MVLKIVNSLVRELLNSWIYFVIASVAVAFFPIIVVAHFNQYIGQTWYGVVFSIGYFVYLKRVDIVCKKKLFEELPSNLKPEPRILELGPGVAANFSYYSKELKLSTFEQNPVLQKEAEKIKQNYPGIVIERCFIGNAEKMSQIHDNSFDVVIATHVLCCVDNPQAAVNEIYRILRRGGKYFCLESVAWNEEHYWRRLLISFMSPVWKFMLLGCKAGNIDVKKMLINAGFDVRSLNTYYEPRASFNMQIYLYGVAVKK